MHAPDDLPLSPSLLERILERLEVSPSPPSLSFLGELYAAWRRKVPFDNLLKRIHVHVGNAGPLPGSDAEEFFRSWLETGAGGTCWSGSGALFALLKTLGFEAERAVATMLVAPGLPPNHGSVRVHLEGVAHLVDTSILHGAPIPLVPGESCGVSHPAWGVAGRWEEGLIHLDWRPLHQPAGLTCRFDRFGADAAEYRTRYEETRGWSPFNFEITARRNLGNEVIGVSFGKLVTFRADGSVEVSDCDDTERRRFLVETMGFSESIVARLPEDTPTPPPPGSKAAGSEE